MDQTAAEDWSVSLWARNGLSLVSKDYRKRLAAICKANKPFIVAWHIKNGRDSILRTLRHSTMKLPDLFNRLFPPFSDFRFKHALYI